MEPQPLQATTRRSKRLITKYSEEERLPKKARMGDDGIPEHEAGAKPRQSHHDDAAEPDAKLACVGEPPAWADNIQQICETFPRWYRAHQSSMYTKEKVMYGLRLDKGGNDSEVIGEQVIITDIGGGKVKNENSQMVRNHDQAETATFVQAAFASMNNHTPVLVIIGQKNESVPVPLPHPYNVFGFFHVTDIWLQRAPTGATYHTMRLEKIVLNEMSWWSSGVLLENDRLGTVALGQSKALELTCPTCGNLSKTTFAEGWACLHKACEGFLMHGGISSGSGGAPLMDYTYHDDFLRERTAHPRAADATLGIASDTPMTLQEGDCGTEAKYRQGIVCRECRRCVSRSCWDRWECPCGKWVRAPMGNYSLEDIIREGEEIARTEVCDKQIRQRSFHTGDYETYQYLLPSGDGKIAGSVTVFRATRAINAQPNGPDQIFQAIEKESLPLNRYPAYLGGTRRETLTKHFTQNYGALYKYGVSTASKPFAQAPDGVLKAVHRMLWAGRAATDTTNEFVEGQGIQDRRSRGFEEEFTLFNECLALGYFEGDAISYHDDGEKELDATVATLSLGSPSMMKFRPKAKSSLKPTDESHRDMLRLMLYHGDIVVMHGSCIHGVYEHSVTPFGLRRYALTARYVKPELIKDPEMQAAARVDGIVPPSSTKFKYNGSVKIDDYPAADQNQPQVDPDLLAYLGEVLHMTTIAKERIEQSPATVDSVLNNLSQWAKVQLRGSLGFINSALDAQLNN